MHNEALPYVYKGVHPETGEFYIGSRTANKEPWDIDLPKYRTSSRHVKPRFDEFEWKLLMVFSSKTCAYDYEQYLIYQELGNPLMLNRSCNYENKKRFTPIGTKRTPEQIEKHRQCILGRKQTPEEIEKRRLSMIGKTKGKKFTDEHKEKLRLAKLGKKHSPEHIEKCRQARIGLLKGRARSEEMKQQIRQKLTGYKHTEEAKRNMSISHIGNTNGKYLKGVNKPDGHAENVRQANIGTRFWNNGDICVRTKDCPEGFKPGMLPRTQQRKRKDERQET